MTNAVRFHTTGRENMSVLEKIIYTADATEPGRNYCSTYYVDLVKKDIDQGVFEICKWVSERLLERNEVVHLDTIKCYNYYNNLAYEKSN